MASIINASSTGSGGIVQTADASGVLQLQSNGTTALTVSGSAVTFAAQPAGTFAGTGPAFSVVRSTSQSISAGTFVKVQFDSKIFDTASAYDNTTNYRFQPLVAGYYQINANINYVSSSGQLITSVYKNNSRGTGGEGQIIATLSGGTGILCANLVFMNGSTDYLEIFAYSASSNTLNTGANNTWFSGSLVRAA